MVNVTLSSVVSISIAYLRAKPLKSIVLEHGFVEELIPDSLGCIVARYVRANGVAAIT
jgi:hypothetical protein